MIKQLGLLLALISLSSFANRLEIIADNYLDAGQTYDFKAEVITNEGERIDVSSQVIFQTPFESQGLNRFYIPPSRSGFSVETKSFSASINFDGDDLYAYKTATVNTRPSRIEIWGKPWSARVGGYYRLTAYAYFYGSSRRYDVTSIGSWSASCGYVSFGGSYRPSRGNCQESIRFSYAMRTEYAWFYVDNR